MRKIAIFSVAIVTALALTASAGVKLTHGAIRGGYVDPADLENTWGIGAEVGLSLPVPNLNFAIEGNWWNKSYEDPLITGVSLDITDMNVGVSGRYEFTAAPNAFYPYLGAGLGAHFFSTTIDLGVLSLSDSETKFGIHAFGGFRVPVSPVIDAYVEGRYTWVDPDYLTVTGGLGYRFGK